MERLLDELSPVLAGKRVIYTSSIAAVDPPRDGGRIDDATPCDPKTEYGATKLEGEKILKRFASKCGFDYVILRLPTVYGPGFRPGGMFDVLEKSVQQGGLSARIQWPGKMALVHVDDLARILIAGASSQALVNRCLFVSSNEDPTMGKIAEQVARTTGASYQPISLPSPIIRLLGASAWPLWRTSIFPHLVSISAWRIDLVTRGFYSDGSELTRLLDFKYTPWERGFREMYADPQGTSETRGAVSNLA
jgi:nucleoside-diphosphate-sugar epimerase